MKPITKPPTSLVVSLVRGAALWVVPALIVTALLLTWFARNSIYRSFDAPLEATVLSLIASVEVDQEGQLKLSRELPDPRYQRALSGRYWMIGDLHDGGEVTPQLSSRSLYGASLRLSEDDMDMVSLQAQTPFRTVIDGPDIGEGERLRVVVRQVILPDMVDPVLVLAGADRRPVVVEIGNFLLLAVGLLLLLAIGLIAAVYAQVRLGLRPLFTLQNRIVDVRAGRAAEVKGDYPQEISPLASDLNSLIAHNKSIVERAQTHVGNLAHALKTPIAVLRNEAAAGARTSSDIVSKQVELMADQVDHHLRRARAAARGQAIGIRTDIDPILDGLIRTLPKIYRDKSLSISRSGPSGLQFRGHPRDLEDMVGNLMDNAAKWTEDKIQIDISIDKAGSQISIAVSDNGPGLNADQYPEAIKRGARLDEATPGSGLGLSIVDDLAEAYNGQLELGRAKLGGLKTLLRLPSAKD